MHKKLYGRLRKTIRNTPWYVWVVVAAGMFLRLYRIEDFATFLGDQGRDALVMRTITTFTHLPALGPVTSIGSMYLGPLYYYMMAPWQLLFGGNPVGPAVGVAIISSVALLLQYYAVKDMFKDNATALVSIVLAASSWTLIEYNRFSWNPNLLPPIVFFTLWAWWKGLTTKHIGYYALAGALFSAAMQMHYLALVLVFVFAVTYWTWVDALRAPVWKHALRTVVMVGAWACMLAPFLLFEAIHRFPNVHSALMLTDSQNTQSGNRITEVISTFSQVFTYSTQVEGQRYVIIALLCCMVIIAIIGLVRKQVIGYIATSLVVMTIATSYYTGAKFPHYLGSFYLLFYTFIAYLLCTMVSHPKLKMGVGTIFVMLFLSLQIPQYRFFYETASHQIERARRVAETIANHNDSASYRITALPEQYASYPYRYMLTQYYRTPIPYDDKENKGDELFVMCHEECDPRSSPLWDIALFSADKTAGRYEVDGVTIYKLTRGK